VQVKTEDPLYLRVADQVAGLIDSGTLRPGDKIPSVRHLSRQQKVSIPTVLQAYVMLENRRMIEARPKSGYYVRPRLSTQIEEPGGARAQSTPRSWKNYNPMMSIVHNLANPELVPLGGAIPSPDLLPGTRLSKIVGAIAREMTNETLTYYPPPGSAALRKEISRRSVDWGCMLKPEEFIITNGATEALYLALQAVTKPGDSVLVESPTYYGLLNILNQLGLKALTVPSSPREGVSLDSVQRVIKKVAAIAIIPSFSNPLGSLMPESNRQELLSIAEKHGVPVIEDDIYGDLQHEGERPRCMKAWDHSDNVILCGSFSKTLAPGFRIGYVVAGKHHEQIIRAKTIMNFGNSQLPALAVAEFLRTGGYDHHLRRLRRTYREQVLKMREAVAEAFPKDTRISNPAGGFVLWVQLPKNADSQDLFDQAQEAGISIAPGRLFSPCGEYGNFIRLSCGFPWNTRMENAIGQLGQMVHRLAK
jgi:DNA-binding transcriptional MocR family regulator